MKETTSCVYKTPCGWCSKWDKECDERMHTSSYRIKHPKPITSIDDSVDSSFINAIKICESESDHEWECVGMSTLGTDYRCKKCGAHKVYPIERCEVEVTI